MFGEQQGGHCDCHDVKGRDSGRGRGQKGNRGHGRAWFSLGVRWKAIGGL